MGKNRAAIDDYVFEMMNQNTEMVLEYIDLAQKQIIASTRLQGRVRLLNTGTAARMVRDADGLYGIEIHAVRLTKP